MLEIALRWMYDRLSKVYYSMDFRLGQIVNGRPNFDCSSAVYFALIQAGLLPAMRIGNTDSLFGDLERNGWVRVPEATNGFIDTKRGDVFIWGKRGASSGGAGHTGKFTDANNIIHCAYGYNGIAITNHDWLWALNGSPEVTVYRYMGGSAPVNSNPVDQSVEVGSFIRFDGTFTVNDVQLIGGVWQVRTDELCEGGFTWEDNGIPTTPLVEVDNEGYATIDQELAIGAQYKIPGKFRVLDVGFSNNMWLALIEWGGFKFWIDLEDATEIDANDAGTPTPGSRAAPPQPEPPMTPPVVTLPIQQPEEPPVVQNPPVIPEIPIPDTPPAIEPPIEAPEPPIINNPKEETKMAFTVKDRKQLKVAQESIQKTVDDVAASEGVQELVQGISKKTKLVVYLIGDSLLGLGLLVPTLAIVLEWNDLNRIVALSSLLATAGTFVLTMFGIYKSKNK